MNLQYDDSIGSHHPVTIRKADRIKRSNGRPKIVWYFNAAHGIAKIRKKHPVIRGAWRHEGKPNVKGGEILADPAKKRNRKKTASDEVKTSLMNKYREMFIDKLTPHDLEELQFYLARQYDKERGWNREYRLKFEFKLRQYFHEEILKREIASIETLLGLLQPQDLNI